MGKTKKKNIVKGVVGAIMYSPILVLDLCCINKIADAYKADVMNGKTTLATGLLVTCGSISVTNNIFDPSVKEMLKVIDEAFDDDMHFRYELTKVED